MATTITIQNPDGPKVIKAASGAGLPPVYVGVGYQNSVLIDDGTPWTLSLVDAVPLAGGGPGEPLD